MAAIAAVYELVTTDGSVKTNDMTSTMRKLFINNLFGAPPV
jgi:hypothetical protein